MGRGVRKRTRFLTSLSVALLVVQLALFIAAAAQGESARGAHGPIMVLGDADLCDGDDDGVVNCAQADGSRERPYVMDGWSISAGSLMCTDPTGAVLPTGVECPTIAACPGLPAALIALCNVTAHVVIQDVQVSAGGTRAVGQEDELGPLAGLLLAGATNVTVRTSRIEAAGTAIVAQGPADGAEGWLSVEESVIITLRPLVDDVPQDLDALGEVPGVGLNLPLIDVIDTGLRLSASELDAGDRLVGISTQRSAEPGNVSLVIRDSVLKGGATATVQVKDMGSVFERNEFTNEIAPAIAGGSGVHTDTGSSAIVVRGGTHLIARNDFSGPGFYVTVEFGAVGVIELNRFAREPGVAGPLQPAVVNTSGAECGMKVRYNDINDRRVTNRNVDCRLNARFNWWSNVVGDEASLRDPRIDGPVDVAPTLPAPLATLPLVRILEPADPANIRGRAELAGTAESQDGSPLTHVEVTFTEDVWEGATPAVGEASWRLRLDLTGEAPGVVPVWARACTSTACGVPERLELRIVEPVAPPIALLTASPRFVFPGQTVTLDASASYSPAGASIHAFRFSAGVGDVLEWHLSPVMNVTYDRPGTFTASVEVRDAAGIQNANQPQVLIRVREPAGQASGSEGLLSAIPGPGVLTVLAILAIFALAGGRRRWP